MKKIAALVAVMLAVGFFGCSQNPIGSDVPQYPAGWPQSVAEVARLYDSLPVFMELVPPNSSQGDGLVLISLGDSNQYGNATSVVFSACTASNWYHCAKLETLYSEIDSSVFGLNASVGGLFFAGDSGTYGGYVTLINAKYNTTGVPQEKRFYFEACLVDKVRPDSVKVLLADPRPRYIIKNFPAYHSGESRFSYQMYDRTLDELVDYGKY